jgi:hypothetical protein
MQRLLHSKLHMLLPSPPPPGVQVRAYNQQM